ncbi:FcbC Predicted thioesterase [Burkholderiaceae bacterium]
MSERVFHWPVRVYWEDTDAGGIVFYANYLKFFERARTEWLRHLGVNQHALRDSTGGMFVVSTSQLNYLRPARLDDMLTVSAELTQISRASMTITQTAQRMDETTGPVTLCVGTIGIAWVNAQTLRPERIPPHVVSVLQDRH